MRLIVCNRPKHRPNLCRSFNALLSQLSSTVTQTCHPDIHFNDSFCIDELELHLSSWPPESLLSFPLSGSSFCHDPVFLCVHFLFYFLGVMSLSQLIGFACSCSSRMSLICQAPVPPLAPGTPVPNSHVCPSIFPIRFMLFPVSLSSLPCLASWLPPFLVILSCFRVLACPMCLFFVVYFLVYLFFSPDSSFVSSACF